jgi:hypothetical protein
LTQIITTGQGGQRKAYCVECADTKPELLGEFEKADEKGELEISDRPEDALGEICVSCRRQIDQVRAEPRSYKVKAQITIEVEIDLEAASATEAQYAVTWTLAKIDLSAGENKIKTALEHNVPMTEQAYVNEWTYRVEPAKEIPPDQDLFITPTQQRLGYH